MFIHYLFNKDYWFHDHHSVPVQTHNHSYRDQHIKLIAKNMSEIKSLFATVRVHQSINDVPNDYTATQKFTNRKLIHPTFITKLLNKYWQETIFLSTINPLSDNYINQLKSAGVAMYQNEYKKFLLDFSKALTTRRIEVYLDDSKVSTKIKSNSTYVKYIWRKGLNFSLPDNLLKNFLDGRYIDISNDKKSLLLNKISSNDFPVFTVINGSNQIIMAEFPEKMLNNKNVLDKLYRWYYDRFLWTKNNQPLHEGLFFMNPEDAIEYKYHIQQKYTQSSKQNVLDIFPSKLDLYYKLTRTPVPKIRFRLIPDLKELGELLFKYRKYRHVSFHKQQTYSKNHFKGQPVYTIKPILAFNKKSKKHMIINYQYKVHKNRSQKSYEAIFMNYKTALTAWQKFKKENINYSLPSYPQLLVYNLEDFIKTWENDKQNHGKDILFVPSKESYNFVKQYYNNQSQLSVLQKFSSTLLYFKVLGKRILWSLTSRQPMSW
uniref:Ycf80 n=1 Tax=Grateloupia turuturu TaxID=118375 RepID=A0A6B9PFR0_9FLOR|nr:Ycf80 [Grateloupia turuturu]